MHVSWHGFSMLVTMWYVRLATQQLEDKRNSGLQRMPRVGVDPVLRTETFARPSFNPTVIGRCRVEPNRLKRKAINAATFIRIMLMAPFSRPMVYVVDKLELLHTQQMVSL